MSASASKARKSRRNPRACDACSRRSVRCKQSAEDATRCQNCVDFNEPCTLDRPIRKRGAKSTAARSHVPLASPSDLSLDLSTGRGSSPLRAILPSLRTPSPTVHPEWLSPLIRDCEKLILDLVGTFFEVIFPIFPLFHKPRLLQRIAFGEHLRNRAFYTAVTSICALVVARVRDGAIDKSKRDTLSLEGHSSEFFFAAASQALPPTAALTRELGYMQTYVLLSITSIQYGDSTKARYHLNLYHNCVAVGLLHNEEEWPRGLSTDELEERRRLFWSAYTLDVFTSLIWKGAVHSSELMFNVCYPSEDELLHHTETLDPVRAVKAEPSWLYGWNFVTDLYRLLEHVLHHLCPRPQLQRAIRVDINEDWQAATPLLQRVTEMYHELPAIFKITRPPANDVSKDLYSFQAANIAATVQLVRMVLFTVKRSSVEEKCKVASEVIRVFANVPMAYLNAISSPLLHHLAGIGILLGSTFYEKLSESVYSQLRTVLLNFATLISDLEDGMHYTAGKSHSDKLRAQLTTLDKYWADQTQQPSAHSLRAPEDQGQSSQSSYQPFPDTEYTSTPLDQANPNSISFPPELLEDWSSIFNFF
ncbi:hypothetical protein Q7P37_006914 [Cladosporium fusiforme]